MAISITKAQADALAEGFFNKSISEERVSDHFIRTDVGLVPKASFSALIQAAGFLIVTAQENLNTAGRIGKGDLSESLKIINPEVRNGVLMQVSIEWLFYGQFIDGGVAGTRKGSGDFSFKNEYVGRKMLKAIYDWVRREGIRGKADNKYRGISKREDFRKSISGNTRKQNMATAWGIAKSIKMKGLKRTNFLSKAITSTRKEVDDTLQKAFKIDIIRALPNKI